MIVLFVRLIIIRFSVHKEVTEDRYLVPYTSTRFEKRYIEMDEEILSTVTDIDGTYLILTEKSLKEVKGNCLKFLWYIYLESCILV